MTTSEEALPPDDAPVGPDTPVYRLIPTDQCSVVDGQWEFQSAAFDNNDDEDMSVVVGDTLAALGRSPLDLPEALFGDSGRWGVAQISAGFLMDQESQIIVRTPREEERAHADVRGPKNPKRRKRIKRHAEWVVRPRSVPA